MNKNLLKGAIAAVIGTAAITAAPMASAFNLNITAGTHACLAGAADTWNGCAFGAATSTGGSYFQMGGNFANSLSSSVGLEVGAGTAQTFVGTAPTVVPSSPVDPSLVGGNITDPWLFFSTTQYGVNYSNSDITLVGGGGTAAADMSGWRVAWSEVAEINMGEGAPGVFTYDATTWSLDYSAVVPAGDASGFGGTQYDLHLEGTYTGDLAGQINAVPVPAAAWLFGSGLLGLVGVARRKATV